MIELKTNLNEFYFGNNDVFLKAEKALDGIREILVVRGIDVDLSLSTHYKVLKEALCEVFGFSDMLLDLKVGGEVYEIFTMPTYLSADSIKNSFSGNKNVTTNKYGVCFTKESYTVPFIRFNAICLLNTGVGLNSREAIAILIHEIGHNFFGNTKSTTVFRMFLHFRNCATAIGQMVMQGVPVKPLDVIGQILAPLMISSRAIAAVNNLLGLIKNAPILKDLSVIYIAIRQVLSVIFTEASVPVLLVSKLMLLPMNWTFQLNGIAILSAFNLLTFGWLDTMYFSYDNEKFSDNFATSYGYGPDILTGLVKLDKFKTDGGSMTLNHITRSTKSDILPWVTTLINYPSMMCSFALLDCHPTLETRIIDQGKLLRAELTKKDLKPETKRRIIKDLDEMDKIREAYFVANSEDSSHAKWNKSRVAGSVSYGGDIRELINPTENYDWKVIENAVLRGKKNDNDTFKGL
ncbi:MAG: hypothetical protein ACRC0G_07340 [Fusobacteriaceae bacterium]